MGPYWDLGVTVHFRPLPGGMFGPDTQLVELMEPRALEFLGHGTVLRCAAGLAEEIELNRTIEELHERVKVISLLDDTDESGVVVVHLQRGVDGSHRHWHDSGCVFWVITFPQETA